MKFLPVTIISTSLAFQAANANDDYINYIVQTENLPASNIAAGEEPTVVTFDNVDPTGERDATALTDHGATFELFSIHKATNIETLVATDVADVYSGTIELTTPDPYAAGAPRIRADQAFGYTITISGLQSGAEVDEASVTALNFERSFEYTDTSIADEPPVTLQYSQDGKYGDSVGVTSTGLSPQNTPAADGTETFRLETNQSFGNNGFLEVANVKMRVLPVATGSISGYDPDEVYNRLPDLTLVYNDLYPPSETWLRFTRKGEDGAADKVINLTDTTLKSVAVEPDQVGEADYVATNLDKYITEAGEYTMEIVHVIPHLGEEILDSGTIKKKLGVKINANIGNSE